MPAAVAGSSARSDRTLPGSEGGGVTTTPMIPAMAAFPRPELIASTAWLEENLGRPDVRVVDLRWRPDGSGARLHAEGHIPGSTWIDWSTQLVDRDDATGALHLAGPERVAAAFGAAGVGDGSTVVLL